MEAESLEVRVARLDELRHAASLDPLVWMEMNVQPDAIRLDGFANAHRAFPFLRHRRRLRLTNLNGNGIAFFQRSLRQLLQERRISFDKRLFIGIHLTVKQHLDGEALRIRQFSAQHDIGHGILDVIVRRTIGAIR